MSSEGWCHGCGRRYWVPAGSGQYCSAWCWMVKWYFGQIRGGSGRKPSADNKTLCQESESDVLAEINQRPREKQYPGKTYKPSWRKS